MPVMSGFGALAELPWERVTDKIERRVLAGQQGMIVWWKMKAGAHAAAHRHPHEQNRYAASDMRANRRYRMTTILCS